MGADLDAAVPLPSFAVFTFIGLERYWYWVIGYWAIFTDIG